jgi:hypothetical protein
VFVKVIDSCTNSEGHVQYAGEPNKLLCKGAGTKEVSTGEDQCDAQHEGEKDYGVGVERKIVTSMVYPTSVEPFVFGVPIQSES